MNTYKKIGIVGGQGPASTADIYLRIVKHFQNTFGARYVRDFPPMIIMSVPTPDLVERVENEELTFSMIGEAVKELDHGGADFIMVACISLQYLISRLQSLTNVPIIGVAPIVARYAKEKGYKTLGILGTETTTVKKVFDSDFGKQGIALISPTKQEKHHVAETILNEIGGRTTAKDRERLKNIVKHLQERGADAVVLACTELPLVIAQADVDATLIDCNELYVQKAAQLSSSRSLV